MRLGFFNLTLHLGEPRHPMEMRVWTGNSAYRPRGAENSIVNFEYTSHKIEQWYGLTYKRAWFIGFCMFGVSTQDRNTILPSYVPNKERDIWGRYDSWPLAKELTDD